MVKVKLTTKLDSDVLVVGLGALNKKLQIESGTAQVDSTALLSTLNAMGATGKNDEVIKLPGKSSKLIVFTGLGKIESNYNPEVLRRAAGAAARELSGNKSASFSLPHKSVVELAAIAEGAALGSYSFTDFLGNSKKDQKDPLSIVNVLTKFTDTAQAKSAARRAEIIAEQTFLVRDLINTPPSHLTPDSFCLQIKKLASKYGVKVEVINDAALRKGGYGGIIGVGQGSANPPRLLRVSYTPAKAKKRYAFVGKGITFDTGGLALKPAAGMEAMKADMSGAAAVVASVFAIAQLKLPVAVDAWAPLAENMVSDTATRPSDVITIYGGKTVEVLNPDAEGRLVLADALVKAAEVGKKSGGLDGIIDVATLTGAQVVALGSRTSAVMTNDENFSGQFLTAANISGEAFWPMPLPVELRASLDSPIADLANIGDRMGGMLVAGLFLKEFIDPQTPWLHLDIAGPAFNEKSAHGYTPVGGTGIALRSLICLAELASSQS
ncbi:MAG: leucyl aminopeptidase [Actinomycetes bacterium]